MTIFAIMQAQEDTQAIKIQYDPKSETERQEVTRRILDFWRHEREVDINDAKQPADTE